MKKITQYLISPLLLMIFWLLGWWLFRVRNHTTIIGKENLPPGTGILLLSNHQSLIDSLLIGYALFSPWDVIKHYHRIPWNAAAWENFFQKPSRRWFCFFLKTIPAYRHCGLSEANLKIKEYENILRHSNLLLFFEGTRSRDGQIGDCRYGPASVVIGYKPVVIPIRINGMNEVMPINIGFKWQKIKRGKKISLHIGPAINFSDFSLEAVRRDIKNSVQKL